MFLHWTFSFLTLSRMWFQLNLYNITSDIWEWCRYCIIYFSFAFRILIINYFTSTYELILDFFYLKPLWGIMENMILRVINNIICVEHPACQEMTNDTGEILSVWRFVSCINFVYSLILNVKSRNLISYHVFTIF